MSSNKIVISFIILFFFIFLGEGCKLFGQKPVNTPTVLPTMTPVLPERTISSSEPGLTPTSALLGIVWPTPPVIYISKIKGTPSPAGTATPTATFTPTETATPTATHTPGGLLTPDPETYPESALIKPGRGFAKMIVGETVVEGVEQWLGESEVKIITEEEDVKLIYSKYAFTFWFDFDTRVLKKILIQNGDYRTREGVYVGVNIVDVKYTYKEGNLNAEERIYSSGDGTSYYYDETGRVTGIMISQKKIAEPTPLPVKTAEATPVTTPSPIPFPATAGPTIEPTGPKPTITPVMVFTAEPTYYYTSVPSPVNTVMPKEPTSMPAKTPSPEDIPVAEPIVM